MIYDLTRPITSGMPVYPGDPPVQITPLPNPPWQISALQLGSHSGTHLDAPRHRFAGGVGIDAIPPARLVGPGIVIDAGGYEANAPIGPEVLAGVALPAGLMVLIRTGWEAYWGTDVYARHPYLSAGLAQALVDVGVTLVGIDAFSVDSTVDGNDAAHLTLLGNNILIAENLCNLAALECGTRYTFAFLPLPLVQADGAPARVLAWREK
ncbi:cyclase family protein [uncultured Chloroflexus sp.]|uniref:cyclase family protein n=1 Tax=uncultured Chloroflexus sp. TaxID=214040 RepID=UPI00260F8F0A|nr:cyclase family protein [uncultured Chloroflexus sp.]